MIILKLPQADVSDSWWQDTSTTNQAIRNCSTLPPDFYLCKPVTFCHSVKTTCWSTKVSALKQQVLIGLQIIPIYFNINQSFLGGQEHHINEEQSIGTGTDHQKKHPKKESNWTPFAILTLEISLTSLSWLCTKCFYC